MPSGQAVLRIDGKDHYCGAFGTAAAKQTYDRFIAEWILRGQQPARVAALDANRELTVSQ